MWHPKFKCSRLLFSHLRKGVWARIKNIKSCIFALSGKANFHFRTEWNFGKKSRPLTNFKIIHSDYFSKFSWKNLNLPGRAGGVAHLITVYDFQWSAENIFHTQWGDRRNISCGQHEFFLQSKFEFISKFWNKFIFLRRNDSSSKRLCTKIEIRGLEIVHSLRKKRKKSKTGSQKTLGVKKHPKPTSITVPKVVML